SRLGFRWEKETRFCELECWTLCTIIFFILFFIFLKLFLIILSIFFIKIDNREKKIKKILTFYWWEKFDEKNFQIFYYFI
ncbi:MAG: hypothetical protein N7Q72_02590, partial [Spiroplasma sp. Tabriz.8]|nr:hypothetical protein [Spiroplasma sp. Tabriz.8]